MSTIESPEQSDRPSHESASENEDVILTPFLQANSPPKVALGDEQLASDDSTQDENSSSANTTTSNVSNLGELLQQSLDGAPAERGDAILNDTQSSTEALRNSSNKEATSVSCLRISNPSRFAFLEAMSPTTAQDLGDFFFNFGLHEEAFPFYEHVLKSRNGDTPTFLDSTACVRAASTLDELTWTVAQNAQLQWAQLMIEKGVEWSDSDLAINSAEKFLSLVLLLEAQARIDGAARRYHDGLPSYQAASCLLERIPYGSTRLERLLYYYLDPFDMYRQTLPHSLNFQKRETQIISALPDRNFISEGPREWDTYLETSLEWSISQLQRVVDSNRQSVYINLSLFDCEKEKDLWLVEASLYCMLWDAYSICNSVQPLKNLTDELGCSAAEFLTTVAAVAVEYISLKLHASGKEYPAEESKYTIMAIEALQTIKVQPAGPCTSWFLSKMNFKDPLRQMRDTERKKTFLRHCWYYMSSFTVSGPCYSLLHSLEDARRKAFDQQHVTVTDLSSMEDARWKAFDQQHVTVTDLRTLRHSSTSRDSNYSSATHRNSDRSFASFKATADRIKQSHRQSRSSDASRSSFTLFMEQHMYRLSDNLSIMSLEPRDQEVRFSREGSSVMNDVVMERPDEDENVLTESINL